MSTITRERLTKTLIETIALIKERSSLSGNTSSVSTEVNAELFAEITRIALASMESKPVAYTDADELRFPYATSDMWPVPLGHGSDLPLYAFQPALIVPDYNQILDSLDCELRSNILENEHVSQASKATYDAFLKYKQEAIPTCNATVDVIRERQRQQSVKGYKTQQDDTYIEGELAAAAICYIEPLEAESWWPAGWHDDSFKPTDYRRNLVKAGALILAEIERLDRQTNNGDVIMI
ncbi:TPA: hypothetical protein ACNV1G_004556 [Citrobacter amalonaticus]